MATTTRREHSSTESQPSPHIGPTLDHTIQSSATRSVDWSRPTAIEAGGLSSPAQIAELDAPPPATRERRQIFASFARRNHIRNKQRHPLYAQGTWRTRMKKTKCWRCELESRRQASTEALRDLSERVGSSRAIWKHRWDRVNARLRWTCFCRYRAYEDDGSESEDEIREVETRARLGRYGGRL